MDNIGKLLGGDAMEGRIHKAVQAIKDELVTSLQHLAPHSHGENYEALCRDFSLRREVTTITSLFTNPELPTVLSMVLDKRGCLISRMNTFWWLTYEGHGDFSVGSISSVE